MELNFSVQKKTVPTAIHGHLVTIDGDQTEAVAQRHCWGVSAEAIATVGTVWIYRHSTQLSFIAAKKRTANDDDYTEKLFCS